MGVHTIKKSVLELILVIHSAGAYHVFPEHEVTKSITTPTLDGMSVHHKGTPCQTMLRILLIAIYTSGLREALS